MDPSFGQALRFEAEVFQAHSHPTLREGWLGGNLAPRGDCASRGEIVSSTDQLVLISLPGNLHTT